MKRDKELYEIYFAGIQNHEYYNRKHNKVTKYRLLKELKYFIWIMLILLLSPYTEISDKKVYLVYADIHERILNKNKDFKNPVYIGRILGSPMVITKNNSIFSIFRMKDRFKLLVKSYLWQYKNKVGLTNFAHGIDFYLLHTFIKKSSIDEIVISGHFDRYATWISLICKKEKINLTIDQHGALEKINIPNKIYVNTIKCFNKYEEEYFKKFILDENRCIFLNKGFESNLKFCEYKEKDRFTIGIASQDMYTQETLRIIKYLNSKYLDKIRILVYPHPREAKSDYNDLNKYDNIEITMEYRHSNIDMLFTFFSTLVYDYIQFSDVKIICYPPDNIDMSFFNNSKITIITKVEEIDEFLNEL